MSWDTWKRKTREKIYNLINEADLEGLLKMGCPADEYKPEIQKIAFNILLTYVAKNKITEKQVCKIIAEVFNTQFGDLGTHKTTDTKIVRIAKAFKKWEKANREPDDR